VKAFRAGRNTSQQEPSEQHNNALGKEGARKPEVTLNEIPRIGQHKKSSDVMQKGRAQHRRLKLRGEDLLTIGVHRTEIRVELSDHLWPAAIKAEGFGKTNVMIWLPARILGAGFIAQRQETILD
jgi:hypothetical protein